MEYSKQLLGQFKSDYQRYGKFNLEVQVPHLVKLAGFYERKYKLTKHWTDSVKAHALYNSVSRRQPQSCWEEKIFKVQKEYWDDGPSFNSTMQQALTSRLKQELETIRNQCREDILAAGEPASRFDGVQMQPNHQSDFYARVSRISLQCSDGMVEFAGKIISESVNILKPRKPPCDFVAVAIGSLARGEATPYSDLEFLFLVEDDSPKSIEYFEELAITTYFQIGNFGETKLTYMSIKELKGWFDDQGKNGFKIDGLTDQAGNIPTGNGSTNLRNHLITTPTKLAERYLDIFLHPNKKHAYQGDLTAMLSYMKPIFYHQCHNKDLLKMFQTQIRSVDINASRQKVNCEMLKADIRKFSFKPDSNLLLNGSIVDVKREVYRFPSILLLDINIVTQTNAISSWQSLTLLHERRHVSSQLKFVLRFLLACATYMRLSAYLFHDSQDERISVGQERSHNFGETKPNLFASQRRWFVPIELFLPMCSKIILLKQHLAASSKIVSDLQTLELSDDDSWCNITTLFYTGRFGATLALLKKTYGDNLCDDPPSVSQNIPAGQNLYETRCVIAETLFQCHQYRAALTLYELLAATDSHDWSGRIANCYIELGYRREAIDILERINVKSHRHHSTLGQAYSNVKEFEKSEHSFFLALELSCSEGILTDELQKANVNLTNAATHDERLSRITDISPDVIACVASLGLLYSDQQQHLLGNKYSKTALHLTSELYGSGAATPFVSETLSNIGTNYHNLGEFTAAIDHYKQALSVYRKLSVGTDDVKHAFTLSKISHSLTCVRGYDESMKYFQHSLDVLRLSSQTDQNKTTAHTLRFLGRILMKSEKFNDAKKFYMEALAILRKLSLDLDGDDHMAEILLSLSRIYKEERLLSEAEEHCNQALAMYRRLSQGRENRDTAMTLQELGAIHMNMRLHIDAENNYRQSLAIYIALVNGERSFEIASLLSNLGANYTCMAHYKKAEYYNEQAIAEFRGLSLGAPNILIAKTLQQLGFNYLSEGMNTTKAIERYREAVHMYIRVDPESSKIGVFWNVLSLYLNHHHRV